MAQRDIVQDFVNKRVPNRGRNKGIVHGEYAHMYYDNDILYSYGHHFPLLIRQKWGYLLNADNYSVTTSRHQGMCRSVATVQIPLSALRQARIPYNDFNLVDKGEERVDIIGYKKWAADVPEVRVARDEYWNLPRHERHLYQWGTGGNEDTFYIKGTYEHITPTQYQTLPESEREIWTAKEERRPQHDVISYKGKYYLSGIDGQNYFLCQLPKRVKTVDEAFKVLIPPVLRNAFPEQLKRQGEWFFIQQFPFPCPNLFKDERQFYNKMERNFVLPKTDERSHSHTATRGIKIGKDIFVSGSIRHSEHGTLHLSKADNPIIYQVFKNTARQSFSVNGRVD